MILDESEKGFQYVFGCHLGSWPINYLGVPGSRWYFVDWVPLIEYLGKHLDGLIG